MRPISEEISQFLLNEGFVIVSTIDPDGGIHNSCKGIVKIDRRGLIYLLDLYRGKTEENLRGNRHVSISAVDEHKFRGWCLKGKAKLVSRNKLQPVLLKSWEEKITQRITQRLLRNIREKKGHPKYPESVLPKPAYMVAMEVQEIINLAPV